MQVCLKPTYGGHDVCGPTILLVLPSISEHLCPILEQANPWGSMAVESCADIGGFAKSENSGQTRPCSSLKPTARLIFGEIACLISPNPLTNCSITTRAFRSPLLIGMGLVEQLASASPNSPSTSRLEPPSNDRSLNQVWVSRKHTQTASSPSTVI